MKTVWFAALRRFDVPRGSRAPLPALHSVGGVLLFQGHRPPVRIPPIQTDAPRLARCTAPLSGVRNLLSWPLLDDRRDLQPERSIEAPRARRHAILLALVAGSRRHRHRSAEPKTEGPRHLRVVHFRNRNCRTRCRPVRVASGFVYQSYFVPGRRGGLRGRSGHRREHRPRPGLLDLHVFERVRLINP